MNQFTVLLSVVCIALAQGASTGHRIVGGVEIDIQDVPFQVSLQVMEHICSGSIIGQRWILTSVPCAKWWSIPGFELRVGSTRYDSGGQLVKVTRFVQHPKFDIMTQDYDFALLELEESLQLSEEFYAVELPEQDEPVEDGLLLQVSGWGRTVEDAVSYDVLRAANVPAVNQDVCRKLFDDVHEFTDRMLCAGLKEGGKDACFGDSGGPLVAGRTLVGVVSWGVGCADPQYPGVYSRVATARDWIKEISGI